MEPISFKVEVSEKDHQYVIDGKLRPHIFVKVGQSCDFDVNIEGHPFYITESPIGAENVDGVERGKVQFNATKADLDRHLFYQCTRHPKMGYKIIVLPH